MGRAGSLKRLSRPSSLLLQDEKKEEKEEETTSVPRVEKRLSVDCSTLTELHHGGDGAGALPEVEIISLLGRELKRTYFDVSLPIGRYAEPLVGL